MLGKEWWGFGNRLSSISDTYFLVGKTSSHAWLPVFTSLLSPPGSDDRFLLKSNVHCSSSPKHVVFYIILYYFLPSSPSKWLSSACLFWTPKTWTLGYFVLASGLTASLLHCSPLRIPVSLLSFEMDRCCHFASTPSVYRGNGKGHWPVNPNSFRYHYHFSSIHASTI